MIRIEWDLDRAGVGSRRLLGAAEVDRARKAAHQYGRRHNKRFSVVTDHEGTWLVRLRDVPCGTERQIYEMAEGDFIAVGRLGGVEKARILARSCTVRFRPARYAVGGGVFKRLAPKKKASPAAPLRVYAAGVLAGHPAPTA